MAYGIKVSFEPVREVAAAGVGVNYAAVGTATTDFTRLVNVVNTTDAEVYISFDGVNNHIRLPINSFQLFDLTANQVNDSGLFIAKGTIFYAKRVAVAPTTGSVWIEVMYASGGGV